MTVLSADLESETVVISRNSNCPVIVKTEEYLTVYDDSVSPIGVNRHMKPLVYELPFSAGMVLVSYTDGIAHAGKKYTGSVMDMKKIISIIESSSPEDCDFIAKSILEYALLLDKEKAGDDMTVVAMGLAESSSELPKIEQLSASYPF